MCPSFFFFARNQWVQSILIWVLLTLYKENIVLIFIALKAQDPA